MRSKRFFALSFGMILSLVLAITGCADPKSPVVGQKFVEISPDKAKVTIGLTFTPDIQFAPVYVALEKGLFKKYGIDVTLRHHGAQEPLFGALEAGQEDIVFASGDEMLVAATQGIAVKSFQTIYQQVPLALITKGEQPISSWAQLQNYTIGVPGEFGSSWFSYLYLKSQAQKHGVTLKHQIVGWTGQTALSTDKVNAIIGFSNNDSIQLREAGVKVSVLSLTQIDKLTDNNTPSNASSETSIETEVKQQTDSTLIQQEQDSKDTDAATAGASASADLNEHSSSDDNTVDKLSGSHDFPLVSATLGVGQKLSGETAVLQAISLAMKESLQSIISDPKAAVEYSKKYVPTLSDQNSREKAIKTLTATIPLYGDKQLLGSLEVSKWPKMMKFLLDNNLIEKAIPLEDAVVELEDVSLP